MPEEWLLDGYNLIHEISPAGNRNSKKSESFLIHFISRLAGFAAFTAGRKLNLVLDGKTHPKEWDSFCTDRLGIVSSGEITADSYIERFLCKNKNELLMTVVTKDRAIIQMARGSGARTMEPKEFERLMSEAEKENSDLLFRQKVKSHGFHRPFHDKL